MLLKVAKMHFIPGCWAAGTTQGWHPQGWGRAGSEGSPGRAAVLPTSGSAGSAGGSGYSSRAQPESLSDEAGGRPVAVPQGGGSSRWGHAGLGRDMSWGESGRAGESRGSRVHPQDTCHSHGSRTSSPLPTPARVMLGATATSRPSVEPLLKSKGFWMLFLSLQG